ncbi:MAG: gluconokinase [Hyphomicrobiales bacterium]|nr:gluconokinase [Hyphomicrobiales bacterium]
MSDGETRRADDKPVVVVMGVSGCGKTFVGEKLAGAIGADFLEGDSFHPPENIALMSSGHPLDDAHRAGWLDAIGKRLAEIAEEGDSAVAACSALKRIYRDRLRSHCPRVVFAHLAIDKETARARISGRKGHFMPASLVDSQFADLQPLEPDEAGVTLDGTADVSLLVPAARKYLEQGRDKSAGA